VKHKLLLPAVLIFPLICFEGSKAFGCRRKASASRARCRYNMLRKQGFLAGVWSPRLLADLHKPFGTLRTAADL